MICLSKADESLSRHVSWNQNPAPLTATQTTCQDLNGMANLRIHVDSGQDDDSDGSGGGLLGAHGQTGYLENGNATSRKGGTDDAGRQSCGAGRSPCLQTVYGGGDQGRLFWGTLSSWSASRIWSSAVWLLSVLIVSLMLSSWGLTLPTIFPRTATTPSSSSAHPVPILLHVDSEQPTTAGRPLPRKRNTCAQGGGVNGDVYNTALHVGALFIILAVSTLACAFPILATKVPGLCIPTRFFFVVRHFGTGVLIATAFVHLLPTAFISLGDPCLDRFWTDDYPAIPGAISLAAIFFVVVIEMVFHPSRHVVPTAAAGPTMANMTKNSGIESADCTDSTGGTGGCMSSVNIDGGIHPIRDMGPLFGRSSSIGHELSILYSRETGEADTTNNHNNANNANNANNQQQQQQHRREMLQCVLLELGILFHSVFIGMALSVSVGSEFIVLLIAIAFHQTFEGLALGSRVASVHWPQGKLQPWLMALAYGCTTPLGQAIGLATHTLYSPDSAIGLIVVGVMNAISAGLLTFASLVELLSEDLLSDQSWRFLRGRERVCACLLVFFGAFFMSLVGAWA